jgi:putative transposase
VLPVSTQAELLSLNRSGLSYQSVPPSLQAVALKHRIAAQLRREGQPINQKTVARSLQEMGLAAVYPGPNLSKRARQAAIYPSLLVHTTASAPNHIWGIDITSIRLRARWMYAGFDPGLVLALCRKPGNWLKPCSRALSWRPCIAH